MTSARLLLALLLAIPTIAAQEPLTTHEACTLASIGGAKASPDGRWLAYDRVMPRDPRVEDGRAHRELWVKKLGDDGEGRPFLTSSYGSWKWHPKSCCIIFSARRDGDDGTCLYELRVDGGEAEKFFSPAAPMREWDLAPDGESLIYTATVVAEKSKHAAMGYDQVIFGTTDPEVALRHAMIDGAKDVRIELDGCPRGPVFSPDGKHIAFWRAPTSGIDDSYMAKRLWTLDVASGKVRKLVDNPGKCSALTWRPDSSEIAFISAADAHDPKESQLWVADARSGKVRVMTPSDLEAHIANPVWFELPKDGGGRELRLVFLVNRGCITEVMMQKPDGGAMEHPAKSVDVEGMDVDPVIWRSLQIVNRENGLPAWISVADSARHPRELYVDGRRVTRSNPDTIDSEAGRKMGKQEVVRWKARDGLEIEGVLIWPADYETGKRYPLICMIHGGPEAHYSDGWLTAYSMPGQVAAAQGYFVIHPNYRSSTGRGVKFSKAGQGRSAHEEFDDIVDGVDHLVERGLVDKKRVGITGGSYGGYASAWGATYYSDRFAASVMFVGISEQLSKIFTTDIPDESYLVHWRMRPWGNWMKYLEASPIYYIERAKTPILIMHGEKDPRVPVAQSIELYRALQMKGGVPSRLVLYPREQHGNRNAAARFDYSLRMMRWFNTWIGGGDQKMPPQDVDYGVN